MLYALHRLLISAAIVLGVLLLGWGGLRARQTGEAWPIALGVGGAVAAAALALYLRWFMRKLRARDR
jgi:hypothetical protein